MKQMFKVVAYPGEHKIEIQGRGFDVNGNLVASTIIDFGVEDTEQLIASLIEAVNIVRRTNERKTAG